MELKTAEDVKQLLEEEGNVCLYGGGTVCRCFLEMVSEMGMLHKISRVFETHKVLNMDSVMGIPVVAFCSEEIRPEMPVILTVSEKYQGEIELNLEGKIKKIFFLSPVMVKDLIIGQKDADQKRIKVLKKKAVKAIQKGQKEIEKKDRADIQFFSPPYWDGYSPFSAVPCLAASLKKENYKVSQIDLGIHCIRNLLLKDWKRAAKWCISETFFDKHVSRYKKNKYKTYRQFREDMWFFHGKEYDVSKVKTEYQNLNAVQRGVIDAFYSEIYRTDLTYIDFDRCSDIDQEIERKLQLNFWETLCSEKLLKILGKLPKVIGISITSTCQFLPGCALAKLIKESCPEIKIIFGGSCTDLFAQSNYKNKKDIWRYFDYIIVGEGETAISYLLKYIYKKEGELENIPNLLLFDEDQQPIYTEQMVEDVSQLPAPDYDGLDLELYLAPGLVLPYQTSRGCHYGHCAFCNHNEKYRHHYRSKEMSKVVAELRFLSEKYHTRYFQFVDEAIRPDCFEKMVQQMDQYPEFKTMKWFYYSRVSRDYNKELLKKARKNGCEMVMFGVETLNQRLLNFIKKGIHADTSKYCLDLFRKNGIKTYVWFLCNLPSETLEEAWKDYEDIQLIKDNIDAISVGTFMLEKNTDMYRNLEKYNILKVNDEDTRCFISHNNGNIIDKNAMLRFYEEKYFPLMNEWSFTNCRYTIFFEGIFQKDSIEVEKKETEV